MEPKPDTDLNPLSKAPNLRFPVPAFFTNNPDLWFFQLEATFIVNRVTTEKDKYAVVVANLPYSVVRRIPRNLVMEKTPYTILKELIVKETDLSDYQRSEKVQAPTPSGTIGPPTSWPQSATCSWCRTVAATARGTSSSQGCPPSPEPSW